MVQSLRYAVRPGGLDDADQAAIFDLAEQQLKAPTIARRIKKHPATVQWFMYRNGLAAPAYRDMKPYYRGGRLVVPFSRAEDDFIERRRAEGASSRTIAAEVSALFGNSRSFHTVETRLVMLAAREVVE